MIDVHFKQFRVKSRGGSRGGGGGAPPKIGSTVIFYNPFCIKMLKNRAQIALERIKKLLELPGPLSGPWIPAERDFGFRVRNVRSRI